jgi:hypothetical protein
VEKKEFNDTVEKLLDYV